MSKQVAYTDACRNLDALYEEALATEEPIEIVRDGFESVSVISTAELERILETLYLFQSQENAARLLEALGRAKAGTNPSQTVDELRQEFGLVKEEKVSA